MIFVFIIKNGYNLYISLQKEQNQFLLFDLLLTTSPGKNDPTGLTRTEQPEIRPEPTWERIEPILTQNPKLNRPKTESTRNCNDLDWPEIRYYPNRIRTYLKSYWPDLTSNPKWTEPNPNWCKRLLTRYRPELEMTLTELNSNRSNSKRINN